MGGLLFPNWSDEDIYKLNHYDDLLKLIEAYNSLIEAYKSSIEGYKQTDDILRGTLNAFRQCQEKLDMTEDENKKLAEKFNNLIDANNNQSHIINKKEKRISKLSLKVNELTEDAELGQSFRGHQVSNENKRLYIPIFKLFLKYQEEYPKGTLREAVWNIAKHYPGYEDEEDKQRLYKRLNKLINSHNIATLNELKKALHLK